MWVWDQSEGKLFRDGALISMGYSGFKNGKNSPSMQAAKGVGPIPRGFWVMTAIVNSPNTGPRTIILEPRCDTQTFGRSAFRIHGDSIANPGNASHGCIILPRTIREKIWASKDYELQVVE